MINNVAYHVINECLGQVYYGDFDFEDIKKAVADNIPEGVAPRFDVMVDGDVCRVVLYGYYI